MSAMGGVRGVALQTSSASADADDWEHCEIVPPSAPIDPPTSARAIGNRSEDIDAVASSFQGLRLIPPPPTQDGGRFDSAEPFHRLLRQPSPQQYQHALFDPNGTYPQPVSPATATAAVARFGPLDPVLLAGLENARERLSVLKFEDQIVRFIKNPRESQLNFPPLSSYHRLIIHRLADRCCLEHQTADYNPYTHGYDGNSSRVVTLFKTAQTLIPRVLLIDLSADKQQAPVTPASAPKIMVRKRGQPRGGANGGRADNANGPAQQRTIEDRERAYAEARARIFGDGASSSSSGVEPVSKADDKPQTEPVMATHSTTTNSNSGERFGGTVQATGPDGTKGFGRGNGGGDGGRGGHGATHTTPPPHRESEAISRPDNTDNRSKPPPQNWKESKVLWRNREQEMNDPDFTRNHDAYRPSRDSRDAYASSTRTTNNNKNSNSTGGYQSFHYEGARSFGYPTNGRGRGGEYSRTVDPNPRQPSEFYRQPGAMPSAGYATAYSPHTRPAPPLPSSQQGAGRRGATPPPPPPPLPPPNGGYHDEFPPLGK